MLYPFRSWEPNHTSITFSELMIKDQKKQVRIFSDRINEETHKIDELEFYLPDYNITKNHGFSDDEVLEFQQKVRNCEDLIFEIAEEKSAELERECARN